MAQQQRQRVAAEELRLEGNALFAKGKWNAAVQVGMLYYFISVWTFLQLQQSHAINFGPQPSRKAEQASLLVTP